MKRAIQIVCMLAAACSVMRAAAQSSPAGPTHPWRYAVIFHVVDGVRTYAGVTAVLPLSARIDALAASAKPVAAAAVAPVAGDDIWLAGNGTTQELRWDATAGTARFVSAGHMERSAWTIRFVNGSHLSGPVHDDGTIAAVVKSAQPFLEPPNFGKAAHGPTASYGEGEYPPLPGSLEGMVAEAPVIVRGRVVAVLREQHDRQGDPGPDQYATFVVAVERYLHSPGPGAPWVIKVRVHGGDLPWAEGRGSGVGFRGIEEPMLAPGARYILFLDLGDSPGAAALQRGYDLVMTNGVWGKGPEFDECWLPEPWRCQILLENGMAVAPQLEREPAGYSWKFDDGEELVGLPESIAEQEIETAVSAYEKSKAADGG